ncbi:MAG: flagellar hook protein FlgE [Myxococcales bacterium]|nr:flagellar hook protein FlgE [Myxococcota bacterium]MDW8282815.1 flagellar hook protein FlgE [Myxococcales bacterium]
MSILTSMYNGASGLTAHSQGLSVIGDNIANVNTVGFKASRSTFHDVLGMAIYSGSQAPGQVGLGVRFGGIDQVFTQGPLSATGRATDVALEGGGFFVVSGRFNGVEGQFYTRSGQFRVDADGYLVDPNGLQVIGYAADATGRIGSSLGPLMVAGQTLPARASTQVKVFAALDSRATPPPAWNVNQADQTSNFSTSLPVYDSLGNAHTVRIYFRNTGINGTWEWHAVVDGGSLQGGVPGTPVDVAHGTLVFSNTGALSRVTTAANTFHFRGAVPGQVVAFDFGDAMADGGTGMRGSTARAQDFAMVQLDQDGYAAGTFSQVSIASDGVLTASFSNGQRRPIGRLAIASFHAPSGLRREGGTLWSATRESGEPLIGTAGTGSRGEVVAGALEQSNVDMAEQFVQMIALQRGFQASSRIIQTSDENYVTLVQLKR